MNFDVDIDTAIAALEKNLDNHINELKEATTEWVTQVITALEEYRDVVTRLELMASHEKLNRLFYAKPVDTRAQYSKYLGGLKLTKKLGRASVAIDEDEYDCIFNDNWDWRLQSRTSNATYTKR